MARRKGYDRQPGLELRNSRPGAILILLRGAAPHSTGAFDHTVANNRHSPLTGDHMSTFRGGDAPNNRGIRPFG